MELATYYAQAEARREAAKPKGYALLIERADAVSIFHVLSDFFAISVPAEGRSFKSECPFGDEHPDGGMDKGWRTYPDTNSSMCFVQHGYMGPVRLIQNKYGLPAHVAAKRILGYYGLLTPRDYRERWQDVAVWSEQHTRVMGDMQHAVEALQMALRAIPAYRTRQFDNDVIDAWEKELEKVSNVYNVPDLFKWYATARTNLTTLVGGTP